MKRKIFAVAALIISSRLHAQKDTTTLDEVVVTANKFEQKQSQTGKVISVITKEDLQKSSGKTVAQLLNEQAGITINGALNNLGTVQTTFLRGASSGRTLLLIDGIPVNDPSNISNEFDLNLISINDVERIEICKGAQSTLYGSDAIAGAINIITLKKEVTGPLNVKLTSGFGNKNTSRNNIQLYGKAGKLSYTSRFAKLRTDGFSAAYDSTGKMNFDKDGYDGNVINTMIRYQILPSLSINSFIQHSQYKADIDAGVFADEKDYRIHNSSLYTGVGANFKKGKLSLTGHYQYGELKRNYHNDSLYVRPFGTIFENNRYNGRTQYAELYGNITATPWLTVLAGVDHRWALMSQQYLSISSFGPYGSDFNDTALHQSSVYASLIASVLDKKLNIEIGGRYNDHSKYGSNSTFTFNPSYTINNHLRVFGSIATGFKAPSIFQVYDQFSGNPNLEPETSTNYELGIQQAHSKISSRLVYFHRDIKNGIDYDYINFTYFNFIKQTVNGLELELNLKPFNALSISGNYTFITGEETSQSRKNFSDTTYDYLLRRPKHRINFTIGYQFHPKIFASVSAMSVSNRYDVGGYKKEDVLLKSYVIFNAYAEYKWKNSVKLFANAQNLGNKTFFDLRGYNPIPLLVNGGITIEL